jgi:hypothetical protein
MAVVALSAPAFAGASREEIVAEAYAEYSISPPNGASAIVCHGFGCKLPTEIGFSATDRAQLTKVMAAGRASPEAERRAVAAAAAWFDKRVALEAGTQNHVAKAGAKYFLKSEHQFDCIDTSRNMTTLLLMLEDYKLLRFHKPDLPASRGYVLDGVAPHATAVLTENGTGTQWSVDAWTRGYGQPAEIMPLARWKDEN